RGLRPLHQVPDRMRQGLPGRLYRRQPIHAAEIEISRGRLLLTPQSRASEYRPVQPVSDFLANAPAARSSERPNMVNASTGQSEDIRRQFDHVYSHYDVSNDVYTLILAQSMTYSAAYFERDDMTLEEAQLAKLDLSL